MINSILIVKLSSLGDIIQAFTALEYLKQRFPMASIDWVVEESFLPLVASHPLVRKAIPLDLKGMKRGWKNLSCWKNLKGQISTLRNERYDLLLDFQGNCKSGVVNFFCKSKVKVGFGLRSVREKPNLLSTHVRIDVPKQKNIRQQNISLIQTFLNEANSPFEMQGTRLKISEAELQKVQEILSRKILQTSLKIMVCPGSKWINKQLPKETLSAFLQKIAERFDASFLLVWGAENERIDCEEVHRTLPNKSIVVEKLSLTTWQNLMSEMDLVIAVDSSALHLCGTTQTPTFSLFGPTNPEIFRPLGSRHGSFQGTCPYQQKFHKTCPLLRTCSTGACIRDLSVNEIFDSFLFQMESVLL